MVNQIAQKKETKVSSTIKLTGHDYFDYMTSCVYGWKRNEVWLYIGSSNHGLRRVLNHSVINKSEPVLTTDQILVWQFPNISLEKLLQIESELILQLRPRYNSEVVQSKYNRTTFKAYLKKENIREKAKKLLQEVVETPIDFPIKIPTNEPTFGSYMRVKDLPNDFPITKGTLYNWSADKKHKDLFITLDRTLFIDLRVFELLTESKQINIGATS